MTDGSFGLILTSFFFFLCVYGNQTVRCPRFCGGHGQCIGQRTLAQEGDSVYKRAWDAKLTYGCVCDNGYKGADCTLSKLEPIVKISYLYH